MIMDSAIAIAESKRAEIEVTWLAQTIDYHSIF